MVIAAGGIVGPIDTRGLDLSALWFGNVTARSSTMMTIDEGVGYIAHFAGTGVFYNALGAPISGTITGVSEDYFGQTTFSITNMNVSAAQFYTWVAADANHSATVNILAGNDVMTGTIYNDYIEGFAGHDALFGGAGSDTLVGGDGNDRLYGQSATGGLDGADSLVGGAGSDYLQGNAGNDTLDGGAGSDRINGGADNDFIFGGDGNNTINGNVGDDSINAGDGNDNLRGGQGNDLIDGFGGDDWISGDKGQDTMFGGLGRDIFHFANGDSAIVNGSTDLIEDFNHGEDHIQLGFTVTHLLGGDWYSTESQAQAAAQTLLSQHGSDLADVVIERVAAGDTYLFFNGLGGSTVDSAIDLLNVWAPNLNVSDFI